ncbi:MAG: putative lipoprotein [Rhodocyclales bacterium]|nr:putative lipoprotein [Rhodocyclales bacterium]MDB5887549.1 putative lipoprotein [Rhodocyclales bacterium]
MKNMIIALIVLAGLAIAGGVLYLVVGAKSDAGGFDFSHTQRTLETGTSAKARVLKMRDTGGRLNSNPSIEFELEVLPVAAPSFPATTRAIISTVDLPRFQPGAEINVKYDPADHRSVAVVP